MRRAIVIGALLAACASFAVLTTGASETTSGQPKYKIEFDSAFGLIEGADFKVGGARAGKINELDIDERTLRAIVEVEISEAGVGRFRSDAQCESRPQSLIGEYFVDCQPGKTGRPLEDGDTIGVRRTFSTIGPDLVNNILRLPQRERLRLILNELGAAVAGRGADLNEALRRAVPALRHTDEVLADLASQSETIKRLTADGDRVITALANNKEDVGRFVVEARDTAAASAERREELAATFRELPGFLEELRPTMVELGRVADGQTPALRDLNASADQLERLFGNLGPFAEASRPAFRSLGDAAVIGRRAARTGRGTLAELRRFGTNAPELGKNLAITLRHIDDRRFAVEKDGRSPGGQGYTGLEALLQYIFQQALAINVFDQNGHILKIGLYENHCGPYRSAEGLRQRPALIAECASILGPTQPGINAPDPTLRVSAARAKTDAAAATRRAGSVRRAVERALGGGRSTNTPAAKKPPISIRKTLENLLNSKLPELEDLSLDDLTGLLGTVPTNSPEGRPLGGQESHSLIDYLLAP